MSQLRASFNVAFRKKKGLFVGASDDLFSKH